MTILTLLSSNVVPASDAQIKYGTAGSTATLTAGQTVYRSTGRYIHTLATTATHSSARGMCLNDAYANQPIAVQTGGHVLFSSKTSAVVGAVEVLDGTAGIIGPDADRAATEVATVIGIMEASSRLKLAIVPSTALTP